jgi:hypothetical protein
MMTGERFAMKDERGKTHYPWRVLFRQANAGGNVIWRCECIHCGEKRSLPGIKLRQKPPRCVCQKKKP